MRDFKIVHIEETDSTNRWMKENGEGKMVVVANYQTAGKGCGSNTWESERGKNLLLSILIHPQQLEAKNQFIITQIISVALCKTLEKYICQPVEIKWPNDIYVGNKKICGVLIENKLQGCLIKESVIGIGLNVNQQTFKSDAPNPVSIRQLINQDVDREELLAAFLKQLEQTAQSKTNPADYRNRLYRREGTHPFKTNNTHFNASIIGVNNDGRLMLQDENGIAHLYAFKEVQFIIE